MAYEKVALIGPLRQLKTQAFVDMVETALDALQESEGIDALLLGDPSDPITRIAERWALALRIPTRCYSPGHEEHGSLAYIQQTWDFIDAGADLFVIFPPFDVNTHNAQELAKSKGVTIYVPYAE